MRAQTLVFAVSASLLNACAYNSTMGVNDRFQVASTVGFLAPSVTTVLDTKTDSASTYAGPSGFSQVANVAGNVAGGYLLGQGIGHARTQVTSQSGAATATASPTQLNNQSQKALGGSANQAQGQLQAQGQVQSQGQQQQQAASTRIED